MLFENISRGMSPVISVFQMMYTDGDQDWGHRGAFLGATRNWMGVGIVNSTITYDLGAMPAGYTPPAVADTAGPVLGAIAYANGTATVTGVAENPQNVNSAGASPVTAGVTRVGFYTNTIL